MDRPTRSSFSRSRVSLVAVGLSLVLGCGSSRPLVVQPSLSVIESGMPACPDSSSRFFLEDVIDKRGNAYPEDVGFTQTGLFNVLTPLYTSPPPADMIDTALSAYLDRCDLRATERAESDYVLSPSLVTLQVTEVTGAVSEFISAELRCEIVARETSTGKLRKRSILGAAAKRGGLDTTSYAADVIERAAADVLAGLPGLLKCCPKEEARNP